MNIGSVNGTRVSFSSQSLRGNSRGSSDGDESLRKELAASPKTTAGVTDQSSGASGSEPPAGANVQSNGGADSAKISTDSSQSSSASTDYSSMSKADLLKLEAKGDAKARAELEKREQEDTEVTPSSSGQSGVTVGGKLDVVA